MKIGLISYEYVPDTGFGGIATYAWNTARMLANAGHHVEVVCGSNSRSGSEIEGGVLVHRVFTGAHGEQRCPEFFCPAAAAVFDSRHIAIGGFDVVESPEVNAEGAEFATAHPDVPLVVKLHTPLYVVDRYSRARFNMLGAARFGLGALRRGQWPKWPGEPDSRPWDYEKVLTLAADRVAAPTQSIARLVGEEWCIPSSRLSIFPLPFESPNDLFNTSLPSTGPGHRILFVGRLEPRKGVHHLGHALAIIRQNVPNATLRCLGQVCGAPVAGWSMDAFMRKGAGRSSHAIEFPGPVPRCELPNELSAADVCVFPSLWENFPYVCLEAMTAARAIVGSKAGGMAEMLDDGAGLLVEPGSPHRWAEAICALLVNGTKRRALGAKARLRVAKEYCYAKILPQQLMCYQEAIKYRQAVGPRAFGAITPRPEPRIG
jgi:glycogen(starch) synthase